jgi:hypothetical protein
MTNQSHSDLTQTRPIPVQSMADLVFGRPAPRRFRFPSRLIFVAALAVASIGCASSRQAPPEVESVGTLAVSYHSIAVAPLKHDAPPQMGGVAGTDDDEPSDTSLDVLRSEAARAGAVDVASKSAGVVAGEAR